MRLRRITVLQKSAPRSIKREKPEAPQISPADLIAEAQIIDERRERAAVTDETGRWRASEESKANHEMMIETFAA